MFQIKQSVLRGFLVINLAIAILMLTMWPAFVSRTSAQPLSQSAVDAANDFPNCRLGVGVTSNPLTTYNYTSARSGWYVDWSVHSTPPTGLDYYRTIRVKQDKSGDVYLPTYQVTPPLTMAAGGLGPIVQANHGQVWLIGNEIDRRGQDATTAVMYAQVYHDAYQFIKGIDPTARVAIGSIVQPTPLRLQYLDTVLATYQTNYGSSMPVDVWNMHMYILQEKLGDWGAEVPVGSGATVGRLYTALDSVNINVFKTLIVEMRTWMKARGFEHKPLIITEFGALLPLWWLDDFGITQANMNKFNKDTIEYLNTATDTNLGYPADGYRLVQRSAIYSLDDDSIVPNTSDPAWGTFLFHSTSPYAITSMGQYYVDQIAATMLPMVDLYPYQTWTEPGALVTSVGGMVTTTLKTLVANSGNTVSMNGGTGISTTVRFIDVTGGGNTLVSEKLLPPVRGCGDTMEVSMTWPNLTPGLHQMRIEVDPGNSVAETVESNNVTTAVILVGTHGLYLPSIQR